MQRRQKLTLIQRGRSNAENRGRANDRRELWFCCGAAYCCIELVVAAALFGTFYADLLSHISDSKALAEQLRQSQQYIIQSEMTYMPYLWAVGFIMSPVIYGLSVLPGCLPIVRLCRTGMMRACRIRIERFSRPRYFICGFQSW